MKPSHQFLEHTADVLFTAEAPALPELFEQCALAVEETMVDLEKIQLKKKIKIKEKNKTVEALLFDFLSDLVYYKDAEQLIFKKFTIAIKENKESFSLTCQAEGEKINNEKHNPKVDIKAITMHLFELKKIKAGWWAKVLVDI